MQTKTKRARGRLTVDGDQAGAASSHNHAALLGDYMLVNSELTNTQILELIILDSIQLGTDLIYRPLILLAFSRVDQL
jgi:hypothetical protein